MTASRPIVALGDVNRSAAKAEDVPGDAPFRFIDDGGLRWLLATDDWRVTSPVLPTGNGKTASAESVLDVYVGLLSAFAEAGQPVDNTVTFTPAEFMRRLGWSVGRSARDSGTHRRTLTGPSYAQLTLALDYLRHASIECEAVRAALEAIHGVRLRRANLSVLQSWTQSVSSGAVGRASPIQARFSDHFATLLRHDAGVSRYSAEMYESLPRGVPRTLYRYLSARKRELDGPTLTIPALTLLAHIGGRRAKLAPSRMHEILDEPHHVLLAHGVLGDMPAWSKGPTGEMQLTYVLDRAPDMQQLLRETAVDFGVKPVSAQNWAANQEQRFAMILAAAIQGILTPKATIGAMVHNYMSANRSIDSKALPHFEPGRGITTPKQRSQQYEFLEEQYRDTRDWLRTRPEVGAALRRQMATTAHPEWVKDGLVLLAARRMRQADSIEVWKERVGLR